MALIDDVTPILQDVLQIDQPMTSDTALLGDIPEFDSMAVVSVLTGLEEQFGIMIDDDEVDASIFETVGTLVNFVEEKV